MELHLCISKESLIFTMILLYPPSSDILISVLTKPLFRMRKVKTEVQPFNLGLLKPILRFQPNFSQLTSYFFTSGFLVTHLTCWSVETQLSILLQQSGRVSLQEILMPADRTERPYFPTVSTSDIPNIEPCESHQSGNSLKWKMSSETTAHTHMATSANPFELANI